MFGLLAVATVAPAGIDPDARFDLANADFSSGLAGWAQVPGGVPFQVVDGPGEVRSARAILAAGETAALSYVVPVGGPGSVVGRPLPGEVGLPLAFGARLACARGAGAGAGTVRVTVDGFDGSATTRLLASETLSFSSVPGATWVGLAAAPLAPGGGRVLASTVELRVEIAVTGAGTLWLDRIEGGRRRAAEYAVGDGSFEAGPAGGWSQTGLVGFADASAGRPAYFGARSLSLAGPGTAAVSRTLAIDAEPGSPWHGDRVEAGCWVHVEPGADLARSPDPAREVRLELKALDAGGARRTVATGLWLPTLADVRRWHFVETTPTAALAFDEVALEVAVSKRFSGELRADFVQVGEARGIDGNPRRIVTASYVGWYRSPLSPHAVAGGPTSRARWRNWHWTDPPFEDPDNTSFAHDPDCATSSTCMRASGRRDAAVSTLPGSGALPLAGAYDSRDRDLVRWHVDLARAAGIDSFVYDWLGHALSTQTALPGEAGIGDDTLVALVDAADRARSDFKIGIMFEPKAHMFGWVAGEPDFDARKRGITEDLVWFADTFGHRRPMWRSDGRLVVFVFRHTVGGLGDADWIEIADEVLLRTGEALELVATEEPRSQVSPFAGFLSWRLVDPSILRFASYAGLLAGVPVSPAPTTADALAFAREVAATSASWAAGDEAVRRPVAMAWPGFDDAGVAGWGQPNGVGSDGGALRVRVVEDLGPGFLAATFDAAGSSGADWIHVATWNDWNEMTAIEPVWHPDFESAVAQGTRAAPDVLETVLGRLEVVRREAARFKGATGSGAAFGTHLEEVVRGYVRAALAGLVQRYD